MNLIDLLTDLAEQGVSLWLDGPRLRFSAPDGVMTDELRGTLAAHRQEIIEILASTDVGEQEPYEPIQRAQRTGGMPLTLAQRAMWFQDQLDPGTPAYNVPGGLRISGRLEADEMEQYLNQVIARHEALRTRYASVDGRPVQLVDDQASLALDAIDLSHLPPEQQQAEVERHAADEAAHRLDLASGPPIHARLLRLGDTEHVLLLVMHHSVSDAWSVGVFLRDLAAYAHARRTGRPVALPELPIHYPDFAVWQQGWLDGPEAEKQLAFWRHRLEGMPEALDLPTDRPRPAVKSSRGGLHVFHVPRRVVDGLHELSRRLGATLFMTMAAAFDVLMHRMSGADDVVIGSLVAHRTRPELENLIGLFINAVVLRTSLAGDPAFGTVVERMRETVLGAQANQDLPFELLVEKLQPRRDPGRSPLFQVMLNLVNTPLGLPSIPGLELSQLVPDKRTATLDLYMALTEGPDGLLTEVEYSTDLFDRATIERMAARWCRLLEAVVDDPSLPISRLPMCTETERRLLAAWQDPAAAIVAEAGSIPEPVPVHERILDWARRQPEAVAVTCGRAPGADGAAGELTPDELTPDELTYAELEAQATRLARRLARLGVGPESIVGILLDRSPKLVVAVLGVLTAGAGYLPLDPATPPRRRDQMLRDTDASLVLTSRELSRRLEADAPGPRVVDIESMIEPDGDGGVLMPPAQVTADSPAYIIYTSGSTGRPKGVVLTHRGLAAVAGSWLDVYRALDPSPGDGPTHLQVAAFTFDVFLQDVVRCLGCGGRLVLCPREVVLDAGRLVELLRRERVDVAEMVPAVLRSVVEHIEARGESLDHPRVLACGADVWYGDEYRAVQRLMSPGGRVVNTYGVTEATIDSTWFDGQVPDGCGSRPVPVGRPFHGVRTLVLDAQLAPAPIGVAGELYLGGDVLARGYAGRPDLTAASFVPDPDPGRPGRRVYRTGDLARWTEGGYLELLGRRDAQLKVRGFRIEPGEIESVLEQHLRVRRAAVVGVADAGGHDKRLVAFVVPEQADGAAAVVEPSLRDALVAHLAEQLPEYMVPASFVTLDELPLNANRKVDRRALVDQAASAPVASTRHVPPRSPVEEQLVAIWSEVLGTDGIGVEDSFFELGGHSLLVAQVASRVREAFDVELSLRDMFTITTVAGLSRLVEDARLQGSEAAGAAFTFDEGAL